MVLSWPTCPSGLCCQGREEEQEPRRGSLAGGAWLELWVLGQLGGWGMGERGSQCPVSPFTRDA